MREAPLAAFALQRTAAALTRVSARLRRAARRPEDPEAIHDLRVSIRRFTQCLRTFEALFDPVAQKRVRKRLRGLMKLCGETRNCDIAMELLVAARLPRGNPAYASLAERRKHAEAALVQHLGKKRWTEFAKGNRLRLNPQPSPAPAWDLKKDVAANAHKFLPQLCAEFFASGSAAASSLDDYQALHQFRLRAKRFRYTLELFQEVYGVGIERRLAAIRTLQETLGGVNDCLTCLELVENNPLAVRLVRQLLARRDRTFRDCWQAGFTGKAEQLWNRWLAVPRHG